MLRSMDFTTNSTCGKALDNNDRGLGKNLPQNFKIRPEILVKGSFIWLLLIYES